MRRLALILGVVGGAAIAGATWWRGHRRAGSGFVNRVVDPWLIRHDVVGKSAGEIGLLEHTGRRSGTVRITPVHPVPTEIGFRIVVPLGDESQWARNVLAAGHCRLSVGDTVHELDEPVLVAPSSIDGIPRPVGRLMDWLGFRYLVLHRFAAHPGSLAEASAPPTDVVVQPEPVPTET